jgi:AGZA family xanthine/uracil permease-like MFS transporter
MISGLENVDLHKFDQVVPVALMLIAMPVSGSIGHAIGIGLIAFSVINIFTGGFSKKYALTYVLALLFLVKFFLVA